jgi:hypothetical protein
MSVTGGELMPVVDDTACAEFTAEIEILLFNKYCVQEPIMHQFASIIAIKLLVDKTHQTKPSIDLQACIKYRSSTFTVFE